MGNQRIILCDFLGVASVAALVTMIVLDIMNLAVRSGDVIIPQQEFKTENSPWLWNKMIDNEKGIC